jgi:glycosyltransferase involved in cell wall biosynthesis
MLALVDAVSVSTSALARLLAEEVRGLRPPTVIGDAVETAITCDSGTRWSRWRSGRRLRWLQHEIAHDRTQDRVPLIWFGNHGSPYAEGGMLDLLRIQGVLEAASRRHPVSLTVISNSRRKFLQAVAPWRIPTRYVEWHPSTFLSALALHAIAVIPSADNPFTRCKTNNRLALALAMGLAVVADPVPSYEPFARVTRIGDWENGLEDYLSSPEARARDVAAGKELVFRDWSIERIADQWQQFYDRLRG